MRTPKEIMVGDRALSDILEDHERWLNGDCINGANLSCKDLRDTDLSCVNLSFADLSYADFSSSEQITFLRCANLSCANIRGANLSYADLSCASLRKADLRGANLSYADLSCASLRKADLRGANLTSANMKCADLRDTDLRGANLKYANLNGINLINTTLLGYNPNDVKGFYLPYACPDHGKFIGWKKAVLRQNSDEYVFVELEIPEDAKRSSATGRKCRCNKAKVLSIRDSQGNVLNEDKAFSIYSRIFVYKVGEIVSVSDFDEDRWNECSTGIHFFINMQEAVNY